MVFGSVPSSCVYVIPLPCSSRMRSYSTPTPIPIAIPFLATFFWFLLDSIVLQILLRFCLSDMYCVRCSMGSFLSLTRKDMTLAIPAPCPSPASAASSSSPGSASDRPAESLSGTCTGKHSARQESFAPLVESGESERREAAATFTWSFGMTAAEPDLPGDLLGDFATDEMSRGCGRPLRGDAEGEAGGVCRADADDRMLDDDFLL